MAWYETLVFSLLFVYIAVNIICFMVWLANGFQLDELPIDIICTETGMNIFGKILCSVLVFALLPLMHIIIYGFRFMYWITHVGKKK